MGDHVERYLVKLKDKDKHKRRYKRTNWKKNIGKRTGQTIPGVAGLEDISELFHSLSSSSSSSSEEDTPLHSTLKPVSNGKHPESPPTYHESDTDDETRNIIKSSQVAEDSTANASQNVTQNCMHATTFVDQGTQWEDSSLIAKKASRGKIVTETGLKPTEKGRIAVKKTTQHESDSDSDSDDGNHVKKTLKKKSVSMQAFASEASATEGKSSTPRTEQNILTRYTEMIASEKATSVVKEGTGAGSLTKDSFPTPKNSQQSLLRRRLSFKTSSQEEGSPRPTVTMSKRNLPDVYPPFELDSISVDQNEVIIEPGDPHAEEKVGLVFVPIPQSTNLSLLKRRASSNKYRQSQKKKASSLSSKKHQKPRRKSQNKGEGEKDKEQKRSKSRQSLFTDGPSTSASHSKQSAAKPRPKSRKSLNFCNSSQSSILLHSSKTLVQYSDSSSDTDDDDDYISPSGEKVRRKSIQLSTAPKNRSRSVATEQVDHEATEKASTQKKTPASRGKASRRSAITTQNSRKGSGEKRNKKGSRNFESDQKPKSTEKRKSMASQAFSDGEQTLTKISSPENTLVENNILVQSFNEDLGQDDARKRRRRSSLFKSLAEDKLAMDYDGRNENRNNRKSASRSKSTSRVERSKSSAVTKGKTPDTITKPQNLLSGNDGDDDTDHKSDYHLRGKRSSGIKIPRKTPENRQEDDELLRHIRTFYAESSSDTEFDGQTAIEKVTMGKHRHPLTKKHLDKSKEKLVDPKLSKNDDAQVVLQDIYAQNSKTANKTEQSKKQKTKSTKKGVQPAPADLRMWLDSGLDKSTHIHLTPPNTREEDLHHLAKSTVIERRSKRVHEPNEAGFTDNMGNQSDVDHPPMPSVDESAINTSINSKRAVRSTSKFGPPASTPRRVVKRLTVANMEKYDLMDEESLTKESLGSVKRVLAARTPTASQTTEIPTDHATEIINSESEDSRDYIDDDNWAIPKPKSPKKLMPKGSNKKKRNEQPAAERKAQTLDCDVGSTKVRASSGADSEAEHSNAPQGHSSTVLSNTRKRHMDAPSTSVSPPKSPKTGAKSRTQRKPEAKTKRSKGKVSTSDNEDTLVEGSLKKKEKNQKRIRKKKPAEILEFLHEKELDIMIPNQDTTGLRRSKRVRTSRPLGFGESLVYSEQDKNHDRHLLGIRTRSGFIPIDTARIKGGVIHVEPPTPKPKVIRGENKANETKTQGQKANTRKKNSSKNETRAEKNESEGKASNSKDNRSTRSNSRFEQSNDGRDKGATSWFDDMRSENAEVQSDEVTNQQNLTNDAERTLKLVDADTNSYILTDVSSVVVDQFGTDDTMKNFSDQYGVWISKGISTGIAAQGKIVILPKKTKKERIVQNSDMFFSVTKGNVVVKMGGRTLPVHTGAYFTVKSRNLYSLYNPSNRIRAELVYCMVRVK